MLNYPQSRAACAMSLWLAIVIPAVVATLLWSMLARMPASAQDSSRMVRVRPDAVSGDLPALSTDGAPVTLVRACIAETDWSRPDCAAVLHVLKRRAAAAGETIEHMARRYVSMLATRDDSGRARWVMQIDATCSEPDNWDKTAGKWSRYEPKCRQLFADVASFQRGELEDPCAGATQWGSRVLLRDRERAQRAISAGKWVVAKCAAMTANEFYREVRR